MEHLDCGLLWHHYIPVLDTAWLLWVSSSYITNTNYFDLLLLMRLLCKRMENSFFMLSWSRTCDNYISHMKIDAWLFFLNLYSLFWNGWYMLGMIMHYLGGVCLKKEWFFPNNLSCGLGCQHLCLFSPNFTNSSLSKHPTHLGLILML